jgi:protein-S-isoprenylcysteine O-methyltransferase Ste14
MHSADDPETALESPRAAPIAHRHLAAPLLGAAGLLASGAATVYFLAFLSGAGPVPSIDGDSSAGAGAPVAVAVLVDVCLVLLFGLQHTVMARGAFKRLWTRVCPPAAERSVYVLAASAALLLLCAAWQPIAAPVWHVEAPWLRAAMWAGFAGGAALLLAACHQIDALALFGVRQTLEQAGWLAPRPPGGLVTSGLYRWVRHPIQTAWLMIVWITPTMSWGHLLLAASLTAYIAIGVRHEERDLVAWFGDQYRRYRRRTGAFLPRLWRPGAP